MRAFCANRTLFAERLHLSRPTYYHRLQRGCELLAERLDRLASFTTV